MAFEQIVLMMADMDVFQLFFPWLLVLAVTYGVLEKYKVISEDEQVNGVISLAVAFLAIGGAYFFLPPGIMTNLAAALTFGVFGFLGLMILMAVAGIDIAEDEKTESIRLWSAVAIAAIVFIGAFVTQADLGAFLGDIEDTWQEVVMPVLILLFLLIIVAITAGGNSD